MKRSAPAALRNRAPIADAIAPFLPSTGTVLEISSGTGEHAAFFAARFPALVFQPSDPDPEARNSIAAHVAEYAGTNLRAPLALDVHDPHWAVDDVAAMININMIHIAPFSATGALFAHAQRLLAPGAVLLMYGPYRRRDTVTAPSNEAFDQSLKARNPTWGLRDLDDVGAVARDHGFAREAVIEMPANNLTVVYRR